MLYHKSNTKKENQDISEKIFGVIVVYIVFGVLAIFFLGGGGT